jgi:hypothetical protein
MERYSIPLYTHAQLINNDFFKNNEDYWFVAPTGLLLKLQKLCTAIGFLGRNIGKLAGS